MRKEILVAGILVVAVLASGCVQTSDTGSQDSVNGDSPAGGGQVSPGSQDAAYTQLEQELDQATQDIGLDGLENELLI